MSTDTPNPVHVITDAEATASLEQEPKSSKFKSALTKAVAPIKNHPKISIAVGLGLALVAGAALTGNDNNEPDSDDFPFELEPATYDVTPVLEPHDTEIA